MNKQEIFDAVVNGLASQGFERSLGNGNCRLRGEDGRKCALGWLIPDKGYDRSHEYSPVRAALGFLPELPVLPGSHWDFLGRLQDAHDDAQTPEQMRAVLRRLAAEYELNPGPHLVEAE